MDVTKEWRSGVQSRALITRWDSQQVLSMNCTFNVWQACGIYAHSLAVWRRGVWVASEAPTPVQPTRRHLHCAGYASRWLRKCTLVRRSHPAAHPALVRARPPGNSAVTQGERERERESARERMRARESEIDNILRKASRVSQARLWGHVPSRHSRRDFTQSRPLVVL